MDTRQDIEFGDLKVVAISAAFGGIVLIFVWLFMIAMVIVGLCSLFS